MKIKVANAATSIHWLADLVTIKEDLQMKFGEDAAYCKDCCSISKGKKDCCSLLQYTGPCLQKYL